MEGRGKRREFKVVLDGIDLTEEQERSLSAVIQGVVAGHLAELDFDGDDLGKPIEIGGKFRDWRGRWLLLNADVLAEVEAIAGGPG